MIFPAAVERLLAGAVRAWQVPETHHGDDHQRDALYRGRDCRDKSETSRLLNDLGLPVPQQMIVYSAKQGCAGGGSGSRWW